MLRIFLNRTWILFLGYTITPKCFVNEAHNFNSGCEEKSLRFELCNVRLQVGMEDSWLFVQPIRKRIDLMCSTKSGFSHGQPCYSREFN